MNALIQFVRENPGQVSAVVAVAALIVSFSSMILTVVSLYLSRQHDYKSVAPIASIPFSDYEDKLAIRIKNTGIGPLHIRTFRASVGTQTEDDLISFMPDLPEGMAWDTFFDDLDGAWIPAGEQLTILQLSGDSEDPAFAKSRDDCRKVLSGVNVVVIYNDIYDRRMPKITKSLEWFGRHFD